MALAHPNPSARGRTGLFRVAAVVLLSIAGLLACGRLALDAWLSRPVPAAVPADEGSAAPGKPPPLLFAVVDGLRAEAVADEPSTPMPFLAALGREGARGVAIAGEPTMSAPCVRTLLCGRPPDLYTAFRNFEAVPADGTFVEFMARRGARAAHAGDATIPNLVGRFYATEDVAQFDRNLFPGASELDDRAYPVALAKASDPAVDLLTVHLTSVDLTGHFRGADGPDYRAACSVADVRLRAIVNAFRSSHDRATVLVAADHGLSPRGTHGSGEAEARRAPFVLVGPRVALVDAGEIPQSALAPTLCALLSLPPPPLAESPPAFDLTTILPEERAAFLDAYVRARLRVAQSLGATDVASALDARRAKAFAVGRAAALADLAAVWRDLDASVFRKRGGTDAVACLALVALLLAFGIASAGPATGAGSAPPSTSRTLSAAGVLALVLLAGAGFTLREALVGAADAPSASHRALAAAGVLAVLLAVWAGRARAAARAVPSWRARIADFASRRPGVLLALGGAAIGFPLTLTLAIDRAVHTPILYAVLACLVVAALALSDAARRDAPRARWVCLAAAGLAFAGPRIGVAFLDEAWFRSACARDRVWLAVPLVVAAGLVTHAVRSRPRGGSDARVSVALAVAVVGFALLSHASRTSAAAFAVVAVGARAAAWLPGPRSRGGVVALALALLLVEVAVAHAVGFSDSLRSVDLGRSVLPSAAVDPSVASLGTGPVPWGRVGTALARQFLVWLVLLLPAVRSLARGRGAGGEGASTLVLFLTVAFVARGAAILAALPAWNTWAWWALYAYPGYVAAVVAVALSTVATAVASWAGYDPASPR